jgi:hypothetical protein
MSWRVAKECAERRFGSAPRKQIIMFLADKASDDGSGIWCSKGTIQRHTELGASTVKRTIKDFLDEGILIETGQKKRCKNGHTIVYRLILAKVTLLELTREPDLETGFTVDPVQTEPETQPMVDPVPRPQRTPNNSKTIHKPPPRKREVADGLEAEKILAAYPSDRLREKQACLPQIEDALNEGIAAEELLLAVQAYATESAGFTRSRVCFSDNWFQTRRWQGYIEDIRAKRKEAEVATADHHARLACWISDSHPMCQHITPTQVAALLASELVTEAQVQAAGLRS